MLRGRAWAGEAAISRVEVSTDGGRRWHDATLVGANEPVLLGRLGAALDPGPGGRPRPGRPGHRQPGRRQPERAPDNDDGYLFSAAVHYRVDVACQAAG